MFSVIGVNSKRKKELVNKRIEKIKQQLGTKKTSHDKGKAFKDSLARIILDSENTSLSGVEELLKNNVSEDEKKLIIELAKLKIDSQSYENHSPFGHEFGFKSTFALTPYLFPLSIVLPEMEQLQEGKVTYCINPILCFNIKEREGDVLHCRKQELDEKNNKSIIWFRVNEWLQSNVLSKQNDIQEFLKKFEDLRKADIPLDHNNTELLNFKQTLGECRLSAELLKVFFHNVKDASADDTNITKTMRTVASHCFEEMGHCRSRTENITGMQGLVWRDGCFCNVAKRHQDALGSAENYGESSGQIRQKPTGVKKGGRYVEMVSAPEDPVTTAPCPQIPVECFRGVAMALSRMCSPLFCCGEKGADSSNPSNDLLTNDNYASGL